MTSNAENRFDTRFIQNVSTLREALETVDEAPDGCIRWTPFIKKMYELNPSPWQVCTMICWLRREGYLLRPSRGVYTLSPRGATLLEALRDPAAHPEA